MKARALCLCHPCLRNDAVPSASDICRFEAEHPSIKLGRFETASDACLSLVENETASDACLSLVENETADMALVIGEPETAHFDCMRLCNGGLCCIMADDHPLAGEA